MMKKTNKPQLTIE